MAKELEVVDLRETVQLKATNGHPYITSGEKFTVHPLQEAHLKQKGWAVDPEEDHNVTEFHRLSTNGVVPKANSKPGKKADETATA